MNMSSQNLFSQGFPTNRIYLKLPSTDQTVVLRETTITELKSISKTIIDNLDCKQMDTIYDSVSEYLQSMILTDGIDVSNITEYDRLFLLIAFFQKSFWKDPITYRCPHCGVEIVYKFDMGKNLQKLETAFVEDQHVSIQNKNRLFNITIGWPTTRVISDLMKQFYSNMGVVTEEMERTQFGINFVLSFIKSIQVVNCQSKDVEIEVNLTELSWTDRMDCINAIPSLVVFDENTGIFSKITGYFVNRLENCFSGEFCPQCHKDTYYGISQSSYFYGLFYGSLRSILGYILQVECLLLYRYDCCIFDKEPYMTYNDLNGLVQQIGTTAEKDNQERKKIGQDNLYKGLWLIREILNTMVFPQDKLKH